MPRSERFAVINDQNQYMKPNFTWGDHDEAHIFGSEKHAKSCTNHCTENAVVVPVEMVFFENPEPIQKEEPDLPLLSTNRSELECTWLS